ncbi:MAG TPA: GGDEF domain-containing protein [Gaiellaceae bacterium]|nr:GGDEF domain-containing protein [Gaiellaceae bacterium]
MVKQVHVPADTNPVDTATPGSVRLRAGEPANGASIAQAAAAVGASDVFVFRRVTADRFVHLGGLGRGESWAGNIDLILAEDERAGLAITGREPVAVESPEAVHVFGPYYQRSAVFVPLSDDLLVVFGDLGSSVDTLDHGALERAAGRAAAAIAQVSSAKRLADELELLHAVQSLALTDAVQIRDVMRHVVESAISALSCDVGVIYVAELDAVEIAEHEPAGADANELLPAMRRLFADPTSLPSCIQDSRREPPPSPLGTFGVTSHYVLPVGMPTFAVLAVMHTESRPRGFTLLCREVGLRLAEGAEPLLRSALKLHDLERQLDRVGRDARMDPLTRLPNRRAWEEAVAAVESGRAGIVMIDVDNLKAVNDERGHHVGDEYLQTLAQTMASSLRDTDFLARIGGDEFAILLPEADEPATRAVARRVNGAFTRHAGFAGYPLAASIGYAATPPAASIEEAWRIADEDMYQAKPGIAPVRRLVT